MTDLILAPGRLLMMLWRLWRDHDAPPHQTLPDLFRFRRRIDAGRYDFVYSWLWDRRIPFADRLLLLTERDRRRLEFRMNPKEEQLQLRNKVTAQRLLEQIDISTPPILAIVSNTSHPSEQNKVIASREALVRFLAEPHDGGIVCKPVFGMQGADVHVFSSVAPTGLTHSDGSIWSIDQLWSTLCKPAQWAKRLGHSTDWLIQRRARPHPVLKAIHGDVLGCLRFVTMRFDDGEIGLLQPCWKVPTTNFGVDDPKFGSLLAPVDLATGQVGAALQMTELRFHTHHPGSGTRIKGIMLPDWELAKSVVRQGMSAFPRLRSLGFDLALTDAGPKVIEVNPFWGLNLAQSAQRQGLIRGEFLRFLEQLGAEDIIRRADRNLTPSSERDS